MPIIVTNRLVRRVIDYAIRCCAYVPIRRGNDLSIGDIENHIEWQDAIRMRDVDSTIHPLVAEIAAHFPAHPMPHASDAIIDTYMVEHLHEILGGRPWPTLTPTECRHCSDGFSFLTPLGLHYYLPAYMTAQIVDSEEADVVVDALIGLFQGARSYGGDDYLPFWRRLTSMQLSVIDKWLDNYSTKYHFNRWTKTDVERARSWIGAIAESASQAKNGG